MPQVQVFAKFFHQRFKSVLLLNFYCELSCEELGKSQTSVVGECRAVTTRTAVAYAHNSIWYREPTGIFHRCCFCNVSCIPGANYILIGPERTCGWEISGHSSHSCNQCPASIVFTRRCDNFAMCLSISYRVLSLLVIQVIKRFNEKNYKNYFSK